MTARRSANPFNSAFEAGVRSLAILTVAFPRKLDIQTLVLFDYLAVHSGDVNGPASLHPPVPLRSGELLVRSELIERGILLMTSRDLLAREFALEGIFYRATEESGPFLDSLQADYTLRLRERADWVIENFGELEPPELRERTSGLLKQWTIQFEAPRTPGLLL
jgi:hypothetical protein